MARNAILTNENLQSKNPNASKGNKVDPFLDFLQKMKYFYENNGNLQPLFDIVNVFKKQNKHQICLMMLFSINRLSSDESVVIECGKLLNDFGLFELEARLYLDSLKVL